MRTYPREYSVTVYKPGSIDTLTWPPRRYHTMMRIRVFAIIMFRKWFGSEPTEHWHKDGFMAEASDKRGNMLQVEQYNYVLRSQWHTLDGRLFQLFTLVDGKFVPYIPPAKQLELKEAA